MHAQAPREAARHLRPPASARHGHLRLHRHRGLHPLLARLRDGYGDVLEEHHRTLRAAFAEHDGREVRHRGRRLLRRLRARDRRHRRGGGRPARAGGPPLARGRRPARAHGRCTPARPRSAPRTTSAWTSIAPRASARPPTAARCSSRSATRELVVAELGAGVALDDLGEHRLKDLDRPERLYQVVADELAAGFPPPRSEAPADRRERPAAGPQPDDRPRRRRARDRHPHPRRRGAAR